MRSRLVTAAAGIVVSLLLSAALWWVFGTFAFFLFVPFVPFLFRGSSQHQTEESVAECPACGFRTVDESYDFCPRDGTRLE
ncbi:hypothetical protein GCM10028857_28950 [Salinarchaeum chitinilyticum]